MSLYYGDISDAIFASDVRWCLVADVARGPGLVDAGAFLFYICSMHSGCDIASDHASRLARARRVLRGQLETLVALAVIALRMIDGIAAPRTSVDSPRLPVGLGALERVVRDHVRIAWALRLIWALRAKLVGDLARVERGEGVDDVLAAQAAADPEDDREGDAESEIAAERGEALARETEGLERESFGRYLSNRSGHGEFAEILQRPTEEVIALIREALGLDGAHSDDTAVLDLGYERSGGWSGPVDGRLVLPPAQSGSGLRSPCPV